MSLSFFATFDQRAATEKLVVDYPLVKPERFNFYRCSDLFMPGVRVRSSRKIAVNLP